MDKLFPSKRAQDSDHGCRFFRAKLSISFSNRFIRVSSFFALMIH
jgi:hypothetical protein